MKKVLLYSGGLDSVLANYLWEPYILLHIDSQANYNVAEKKHLEKHFKPFRNETLIIDDQTFDFADTEKDDFIVPFRNVYYILRGLEYGQHVMLGANKADLSTDKDENFLTILRGLVNHIIGDTTKYAPLEWKSTDFKIDFPSIEYNKTELVKMALEKGIDPDVLKQTRTCYDSDSIIGCGACGPCMQKELALSLNGVSSYFDNDPLDFMRDNNYFKSSDPKTIHRSHQIDKYLKLRGVK